MSGAERRKTVIGDTVAVAVAVAVAGLLLGACDGHTPGAADRDAGAFDAGADAAPESAETCPLDVTGTADASGHSPLGPIDARLSWVGLGAGECGGMHAVLVADRASFEELLLDPWHAGLYEADNALAIAPRNWDYQNGGWINTGEMIVRHYVGGEQADATGLVTVTAFTGWPSANDPPDQRILFASFVIDATGWSVSGWIEGVHCAYLDIYCP